MARNSQLIRLPETPQYQEAKKRLKTVDPWQRRKVLDLKCTQAIILWASVELRTDVRGYFGGALTNFYLRVLHRMAECPDINPLQAMMETFFLIPLRPGKRGKAPVDPYQMLENYEALLSQLQDIQRRAWRNERAHWMALKDHLPGVTDDRLRKYASMEPSDIALDYLCRKYKLSIGPDALKKYLTLARNPEKALEEFLQEALEASIPKDLVKRAKST